jgi:hypothetical protein
MLVEKSSHFAPCGDIADLNGNPGDASASLKKMNEASASAAGVSSSDDPCQRPAVKKEG